MASTLFPRTLLYCSNCGEFVSTERITGLICSRKLGGSMSVPIILGSAARRAHGSSALVHAMRDLIASNAPLREGRHTARQNGPTHYPGDPTGAAAPLVCLSPLSFFKQRKMVPPEGVGIAERPVKTQAVPFYFSSGSIVPFFSKAFCRSIQVPHFPQGFSPPS